MYNLVQLTQVKGHTLRPSELLHCRRIHITLLKQPTARALNTDINCKLPEMHDSGGLPAKGQGEGREGLGLWAQHGGYVYSRILELSRI